MPLSIIVYDGEVPDRTRPLLATSDPAIIEAVTRLLTDRLAGTPPVVDLHRTRVKVARRRLGLDTGEEPTA
jgi:hypothetical protein